MTTCEWIVCERSGRWAASLRIALARQATRAGGRPHLYEARSLGELAARLNDRPCALGLLEVRPANLGDVLAWLADVEPSHPQARFVALLDSSFSDRNSRNGIEDVLAAAGAVEIAESPRRLQHILLVGQRHAGRIGQRVPTRSGETSLADWAWASLPWQKA